jgi:hypothetical protein
MLPLRLTRYRACVLSPTLCAVVMSMCSLGCGGPRYDMSFDFELCAEHTGDFLPGQSSWRLIVSSRGPNSLVMRDTAKEAEVPLIVSAETLLHLRSVLADEDIFTLPASVGKQVIDGSERRITIRWGRFHKSVKIWNLGGPSSANERSTYERAATIWAAVRSLIAEDRAADIRPYERILIKERPRRE